MKKLWLLLALVFVASPLFAQQSVVVQVKADLLARGFNLSGECGAFEVVKRVAWNLRGQGFGLVAKSGGSNCQGYSTDLIQSASQWVDILGDAGGQNEPQWSPHSDVTPSMWRPAIDPGDTPTPVPVPVPVPVPTPIDLSGVLSRIDWTDANTERRYLDLKAEAQAAVARDVALAAALAKHDAEHGVLYDAATNRYVQIFAAILGTWVTTHEVSK